MVLLAALAVLCSQNQSPTVSFTCRAEPLARIVSEIAAADHLNLSVAPICANDVMVIAAKDVSARDLLDEIAKVDAGEWEPSGDGYIFGPDPAARQAEERHETAHQGNLIHAAILKKLADAEKAAKTQTGDASQIAAAAGPFGMGGASGPGQIAVLSLLKSIDPPSLVVDEMHRAVFSTSPNSMQLPLAAGADAIIGQLIEQHNKSIPKDAKDQTKLPPAFDDKSLGFIKDMIEQATTPVAGYFKADLVVAPMPFLGGTTATLVLYDNKGKVLLTTSASLDTSFIDAILASIAGKPQATSSHTPIELSPETQAYIQFVTGGQQGIAAASRIATRPIPALLKPFLSDPLSHDPLALLPTDQLLALAKSAKKPMVAVVPDSAMSVTSMIMNSKPTIEEFVADLTAGKSMVMAEQNGWIEVKPVAPESARRNRTDRAALAKLLRAVREKHLAGLDDIAEFAQSAPSPMTGGVTQTYLSLFVPGSISGGMDGITNWDMIRIYGQISPDRRQALISGGKVSLDSLTPTQQGYLNEMVYGPLAQLQVGAPGNEKDMFSQMISLFVGGKDYTDEPTELLPSGIPGGGVFEMTAEQQPFLVPVSGSDADSVPQLMGMDEMAMMKFFSDEPMFKQAANMMPKFDKMKVGHQVVYHLTFRLTSGIRLTGVLMDNTLPDDAETVAANDLPQDMQDIISKKVAEFKKSPLGSLAALGALAGAGAGSPPP